MRSVCKGLFVCAAVALLAGGARAEDVPNLNKMPRDEKEQKAFVEKVARTILSEARTSAKDITLQEYKFDEPKAGRKELKMSIGYKGAVTSTKYTADVAVHVDTLTPGKWEVLKIDYKDNNNSPVGFSRTKLDALVKKFNEAR